jgi:hypothetical protein
VTVSRSVGWLVGWLVGRLLGWMVGCHQFGWWSVGRVVIG